MPYISIDLTLFQISAVAGIALYLGAFAALQFQLIRGRGLGFTLSNIVAAALVLVSLWGAFDPALALAQASLIVIGLAGLSRRMRPSAT